MLGVAAGTVLFARSMGAAAGTAIVAAVLFAPLAMIDAEAARLFEHGLRNVRALPPGKGAFDQSVFIAAFHAGFLTIAGFTAAGAALAWPIPLRRV